MGLAGPKRKQKLVGAAVGRNEAWLGDATLPGQRLLAQMGWTEGQGLGSSTQGRSEAIKAMYKMDNKGIGSQRAEKEAREKGLPGPGMDRWIGGGGELGGLFDRLNASAASSPGPSTPTAATSVSQEDSSSPEPSRKSSKSGKDKKRKRDSDKSDVDGTASSSVVELESEQGSEKRRKSGKKDHSSGDKEERKRAKKEKKRQEKEAKQLAKELKRATKKGKVEADTSPAVAASAAAAMVVRNASRAKFLRAKRQLQGDLVSMNEILGISASPSPAPASPAPAPTEPSSPDAPSADIASQETRDELSKSDQKAEKESRKAAAKAAKKAAKAASKSSTEDAVPQMDAKDSQEKAKEALVLNTVSPLSVHEYLTRRLMLRKAEVLRAKKADQDAVWGRLNTTLPANGSVGLVVE
ncbi:unnamed protein product [Parajaminaea phylloscopi]